MKNPVGIRIRPDYNQDLAKWPDPDFICFHNNTKREKILDLQRLTTDIKREIRSLMKLTQDLLMTGQCAVRQRSWMQIQNIRIHILVVVAECL